VEFSFFIGLGFIAVGSGLLKANISTMVGHLYPDRNDPRRDGGFTIFYMGINLGAFAAPLIIGTVGQQVDWHLGFALAGVGMALGLVQYLLGSKHLAPESSKIASPMGAAEKASLAKKSSIWAALAVVFYGVVAATGHLNANWIIWSLTVAGLAIPVLCFVRIKRDNDLSSDEKRKVSAYIWLFVAAALFWMIYDQSGSTLNLFASNNTSNELFGIGFPSTWFQSENSLFIMAFGPLAAWLWVWLARRQKNPSTLVKFSLGLMGIGISFGVLMLAQSAAAGGDKVSPMWLTLVYLVQTIAELCLSPVGLSVTTKMAPQKYASQMMGLWFLAVTAGDCVAALLQQTMGDAFLSESSFAIQGAVCVLAGVAVWMFRRSVNKNMGDVH
jgi:POT family proton-dependent oligopeptide transporter